MAAVMRDGSARRAVRSLAAGVNERRVAGRTLAASARGGVLRLRFGRRSAVSGPLPGTNRALHAAARIGLDIGDAGVEIVDHRSPRGDVRAVVRATLPVMMHLVGDAVEHGVVAGRDLRLRHDGDRALAVDLSGSAVGRSLRRGRGRRLRAGRAVALPARRARSASCSSSWSRPARRRRCPRRPPGSPCRRRRAGRRRS